MPTFFGWHAYCKDPATACASENRARNAKDIDMNRQDQVYGEGAPIKLDLLFANVFRQTKEAP